MCFHLVMWSKLPWRMVERPTEGSQYTTNWLSWWFLCELSCSSWLIIVYLVLMLFLIWWFIIKLLIVVSPLVGGFAFYSYYERSVSGYDVIWCCNPFDLIIHINYYPTDKLSYWNPINDIFEHNIIPAYLLYNTWIPDDVDKLYCYLITIVSHYIFSLERERIILYCYMLSPLYSL